MASRPLTHRAPALARRDALLRAAVEVVAERGVGGATHRAIAARAGVPLSTTSYFFASLDDLIVEALRVFVAEGIAQLEAATSALAGEGLTPEKVADRVVAVLMAEPQSELVAQFEAYLEVTRRPQLRTEVGQALAAFEQLAETALASAGVRQPREGARALVALADGFALHRLARPLGRRDAEALRGGLLALFSAYARDARALAA